MYYQDLVYGPSGAASSNYVLKKHPTDEEIGAAKAEMKLETVDQQELLDKVFGKDVKVWQKKYSDLDEAIAQLAFEKRLDCFATQYPGIYRPNARLEIDTKLVHATLQRLCRIDEPFKIQQKKKIKLMTLGFFRGTFDPHQKIVKQSE